MAKIDLSNFTISETAQAVSVGEFRDLTRWLEDNTNAHFQACVGDVEKSRQIESIKTIASRLMNTTTKRGTQDDWERRERAIDAATSRVVNYQIG